ncbi:MAG TPA: PepSY domain-containing protein [Methylibium sp.]|uniref:PepSY domain-containing protein n=1 Tax=Methylibium sp. TaxID=2067992 RepID=UPI002DBF5DD3|nr:PepSY domain-containing protein [Methylibium sp.]HEU4458567.1 PepSY domain-containing protein [Methylibium sp.]
MLLAFGAATAGAQTAAPAAMAAPMNFQQVVERVVAKGYSDVREVERKSEKLYEVSARDGQGRRVELYVDARSGEVLREEVKR